MLAPAEQSLRADFWPRQRVLLPLLRAAGRAAHLPWHALPPLMQVFRLNWAAYGVGKAQPAGEGAACSVCGVEPLAVCSLLCLSSQRLALPYVEGSWLEPRW